MRYDMRCNMCGHEEEVVMSVKETELPRKCSRTDYDCAGVMTIVITTPPFLAGAAIPSRNPSGNAIDYTSRESMKKSSKRSLA